MQRLCVVELQLVMQACSKTDLLRLARCSSWLLRAASTRFAWSVLSKKSLVIVHVHKLQSKPPTWLERLIAPFWFAPSPPPSLEQHIRKSLLRFSDIAGRFSPETYDVTVDPQLRTLPNLTALDGQVENGFMNCILETVVMRLPQAQLCSLGSASSYQCFDITTDDLCRLADRHPSLEYLRFRLCFPFGKGLGVHSSFPNLRTLHLDCRRIALPKHDAFLHAWFLRAWQHLPALRHLLLDGVYILEADEMCTADRLLGGLDLLETVELHDIRSAWFTSAVRNPNVLPHVRKITVGLASFASHVDDARPVRTLLEEMLQLRPTWGVDFILSVFLMKRFLMQNSEATGFFNWLQSFPRTSGRIRIRKEEACSRR